MEDDRDRGVRVLVGVAGPAGSSARARVAPAATGATKPPRCEGLDSRAHDQPTRLSRDLVRAFGAVVVLDVGPVPPCGQGRDRLERLGSLRTRRRSIRTVARDCAAEARFRPARDGPSRLRTLAGALGRRQLDQLVDHRDRHVQALEPRNCFLAEIRLVHETARTASNLGQPAAAAAWTPRWVSGWRNVPELDRLTEPDAVGARTRCARSRTRSCRSRSRAGMGGAFRERRGRGTYSFRILAGIRAISSGGQNRAGRDPATGSDSGLAPEADPRCRGKVTVESRCAFSSEVRGPARPAASSSSDRCECRGRRGAQSRPAPARGGEVWVPGAAATAAAPPARSERKTRS